MRKQKRSFYSIKILKTHFVEKLEYKKLNKLFFRT